MMAVDQIARMMALDAAQQGGDSYTKAQTDALLDGKADLVNGKVPASQLPSYVDDVAEGYMYQGRFYSDAQHTQEITGEEGKIYLDLATNTTYRWSGNVFVPITGQADWNQTDTNAPDYIKNKPTIPTVDQTYDATSTNAQSGTAVAQAVSGKISSTDYATQTTGGTVKAWTTTDGSDTILHLATQ